MGVYVKGMKMPETCGKCKLHFLTDDYVCCLITDRIPKIVGKYANSKTDLDYRLKSIESVKRPEWCPCWEQTHALRTETHACDLIKRQDAIYAIVNTVSAVGLHDNSETARYGATYRQQEIITILESLPSANKNGHWVMNPSEVAGDGYYICSNCNNDVYDATDFCPNCGADMRGEQNG